MITAIIIVAIAAVVGPAYAAKILAVFPHHGYSHHAVYLPLLRELANRGHDVTAIANYPSGHPNITDVSLNGYIPLSNNKQNMSALADLIDGMGDVRSSVFALRSFYSRSRMNEAMFTVDAVKRLLSGHGPATEKYDLIVTEHFNNELFLAFVAKLDVPFVLTSSCGLLPWSANAMGQPYSLAISPLTLMGQQPSADNVYGRVMKTVAHVVQLLGYTVFCRAKDERFIKNNLTMDVSLDRLILNASLMLVNTHFTMHGTRTFVPAIVEIGGIHVETAKPLPTVPSANILCVFPIEAPSHQVVFDVYASELHRRGHNVTVYTHYPDIGTDQYGRIRIADLGALDPDYVTVDRMYSPSIWSSYKHMFHMVPAGGGAYTASRALRDLHGQPADAYDLIVTETCNTDLYLALIERFRAPFVAWTTSPMFVWSADRMAASSHPAYVPVLMTPHGTRMDFAERVYNTVLRSMAFHRYHVDSTVPSQRIASERYELSSPLTELVSKTSLLFVATHYTIWGGRPLPPNVIEVGGLHVKPPRPLKEDIKQYIDEAEHGVIYFCMGSLLRGETFPAEKRQMFLNVFEKIPQRILWKWEGELPGKPSNVLTRKWMPQRDILAHPNVKLFISHGGLLGTTEAVHEGVPILSIPIFGDQMTNVKAVMAKGAAEMMVYGDLNEDEIFEKITSMLTNPTYKQKAKDLSEAFRDRPMSPLDTAVYWTEYVIRYKGAPHLRSAAVGMPWYQYYLIDVLLVIILSIAVCFVILYYLIFKVLLRMLTSQKIKEKQT